MNQGGKTHQGSHNQPASGPKYDSVSIVGMWVTVALMVPSGTAPAGQIRIMVMASIKARKVSLRVLVNVPHNSSLLHEYLFSILP